MTTTPDLSALKIHREAPEPDQPRRGRRLLVWAIVLLVASALGVVAWNGDWIPRGAPEVRVSRPRLVQAGGVEEVLTATGYIVPQLRSVVSSRISGRLAWLGVDEGSTVKAGQVIARLDDDDLVAQVAEARASLAQARANLTQSQAAEHEAERELRRQHSLSADGITTESDLDAAKRSFDVAAAGVIAAQEGVKAWDARLALSQANLEKTNIRAPFAGIVIAKSAEIGEMVAAGAFSGQPTGGAIVTVADFASLEMEADINETNVSRVKAGQPALVSVDAIPDRKYRGVLRQIVPAADRQKAVLQAKVRLQDPDDQLMPDMSARVSFLSQELSAESAAQPPRMYVPATAIKMEGATAFVLAVKDSKVVRLAVQLGETRGDQREVTSGLSGGEDLIVAGPDGLDQGDPVRVAS